METKQNQMNNYDPIAVEKLRERENGGKVYLHERIADNLIIENPNERYKIIFSPYQTSMTYIPYQSDKVNDQGWGCAWRSIQMVLSHLYSESNDVPDFPWLFSFFGQQKVLEDIYITQKKLDVVPDYLLNSKYAPQSLKSGWAEPFIGNLIFYFLGFESSLQLINSYPHNANAPQEVFEGVMNFSQFCILLEQHFQSDSGPVMMDDAHYALVVYGIQRSNNQVILFIGDPHINSNKGQHQIGLYSVTLDEQGNQLGNSIREEDKDQYLYVESYMGIHFLNKPWMITYATKPFSKWTKWETEKLIVDKLIQE